MTSLRDVGEFAPEYCSDSTDIAEAFMGPCLEASVQYDRITGYFSSAVFVLVWTGLRRFVIENGGQVRIICSPQVSSADAESIRLGYSTEWESEVAAEIEAEMRVLMESDDLKIATRVLASLISTRRLEIRIARIEAHASEAVKRMFHDKVGVFTDAQGDRVGFRGSMNETFLGLTGNIESIDVWPSWADGRDVARVGAAVERFGRIWRGEVDGIRVTGLPAETVEALEEIAHDVALGEAIELLEKRIEKRRQGKGLVTFGGLDLRSHQRAAIQKWIANGHTGIFQHATGSGKTLTALYCAHVAIEKHMVPIILVPSEGLLRQWSGEVRTRLQVRPVLCGGGNSSWQSESLVRATLDSREPGLVLVVMASAMSPQFLGQIRGRHHRCMVVADEVHRVGSRRLMEALADIQAPMRLGLSATPVRAGDPDGTNFLMSYFGGVVHRYGLAEAVRDGVLVPYFYTPHAVYLTEDEQQAWDAETAEIRRLTAIGREPGAPASIADRLKLQIIRRARISKGASAKIEAARSILDRRAPPYRAGKWLVYCDTQAQLAQVRANLEDSGLRTWEYHSGVSGDREATLETFDTAGGTIVSIRCLDEGIDIPSADSALILASSRNPREFIQRRGRILRRSPGKAVANLEDVLVMPRSLAGDDSADALVLGEVARALEFARTSLSSTAITYLEDLWGKLGRSMSDLVALQDAGFEADGEDDGQD